MESGSGTNTPHLQVLFRLKHRVSFLLLNQAVFKPAVKCPTFHQSQCREKKGEEHLECNFEVSLLKYN